MTTDLNQANKRVVQTYWRALDNDKTPELQRALNGVLAADVDWRGPDPVNRLRGRDSFLDDFWLPLRQSLEDLRRDTHLFFGGKSSGRTDGRGDGRMWVGGTGNFTGTFARDFLGIPASGNAVSIRWGEFCRVDGGKIVAVFCLLDIVDLMRQAGFHVLPESRGVDGVYPPPLAGDGVLREPQDEEQSQYSLEHIRKFIFEGLNSYDQHDLSSMGIAGFFDPEIRWYGPGGIGACYGLREFEQLHQKVWLRAFPDRRVRNLTALIAEGPYSGGPGWAGVQATHLGPYLDCPATGRTIEVTGLDFWKRDGEKYIENWVFVDMIHLFRQFGVDLFQRMRQQAGTLP